eukprot:XP_011455301.2 PREDICTED: uncharacterized protein LOC105347792 [Crassostrea gigas]
MYTCWTLYMPVLPVLSTMLSLITNYLSIPENRFEEHIIYQWKQDDNNFISTKACKEVEKLIESRNLVIVAGQSGSGKSAIIQHIALHYKERDWTVRRVKKVEDIVDEYYSSRIETKRIICVFNNPLGKESFDEILNESWQRNEEDLKLFLKTAKILMSCRNHIISDSRVARYLVNQSAIVDIDNEKYKLSVDEKRHILTKYKLNMNLFDDDCNEIVKVERYFPLLCKLYTSKEEFKKESTTFFTEPIKVLEKEIQRFRKYEKRKFCGLALLVLFNDGLCVNDLLKNKDTKNKFKQTLKLCGLSDNTSPYAITDSLHLLNDCLVKLIDGRYHFYHNLVMEVTTHVFGTDYQSETIKYADIGFLRNRVRLRDCDEHTNPFTVYLNEENIEELGKRLFNELFGNRLIDVVLNPCLKNKKVIETLEKIIQKHPKKLPMLLNKKIFKLKKQYSDTAKELHITKLTFMCLDNDLSPLFVLIVHNHTYLSLECLNTLRQVHANFKISSLLPAVFCNGDLKFFHIIRKNRAESSRKDWGGFYPIHIVSLFHNYKMLERLIDVGFPVKTLSRTANRWTPLHLAAGNDTHNYENRKQDEARRKKTVQILLDNGADINSRTEDGRSPLYIACQNGHDSTVKLLLRNGADINSCNHDGTSPLYVAYQQGHDSTVKILLSNGADKIINLCTKDGASPLYTACQNGHDSTVELFLRNGADINLCKEDGASPLYIACQNGHASTVELLLGKGADINFCKQDGASPRYIACQNGHDSIVELLLHKGADISLCKHNEASPLYINHCDEKTLRLSQKPEETLSGTEKTLRDPEVSTEGTEETLRDPEVCTEGAEETLRDPEVCTKGTEETLRDPEVCTEGTEEALRDPKADTEGTEDTLRDPDQL